MGSAARACSRLHTRFTDRSTLGGTWEGSEGPGLGAAVLPLPLLLLPVLQLPVLPLPVLPQPLLLLPLLLLPPPEAVLPLPAAASLASLPPPVASRRAAPPAAAGCAVLLHAHQVQHCFRQGGRGVFATGNQAGDAGRCSGRQ